MKTSILILLFTALMTISDGIIAEATLIDIGSGLIFDDNNTNDTACDDKYWLQDLALFTGTYADQIAAITEFSIKPSSLNRKLDTWRMANREDMEDLWQYSTSTLKSIFTPKDWTESPPSSRDSLWFGRYDSSFIGPNPQGPDFIEIHRSALIFEMLDYIGPDDFEHYYDPSYWELTFECSTLDGGAPPYVAEDYHDGISRFGAWVVVDAPVPEPSTALLLGSGLLSLAWYARKRNKV